MKLSKIDEVWNSANWLFKWRFRFVVIQKRCYQQRDVTTSPLYSDQAMFFFLPATRGGGEANKVTQNELTIISNMWA